MQAIKEFLRGFIQIIYPHLCLGCGSDLLDAKQPLCLKCIHDLPLTRFALYPGNPMERIFWGRLTIRAAHSEFYFAKGQLIQHLMHELKYKGNREIGEWLGKLTGRHLQESARFNDIDCILPLPLYPEREYKRGYNQAAVISKGISATLGAPLILHNLVRHRQTESQTKKHRDERWKNVDQSFKVLDPVVLENKHVLLVDDVVTTGATMDACAQTLLCIEGLNLSLATLAIAGK